MGDFRIFSPLARLGCAKCAILLHIANRNIQGYTLIPELSGSACWFSSYPCQTEVMFENFADFHTAESRWFPSLEILLSGSRSLVCLIWSFYRASPAGPRSVLATSILRCAINDVMLKKNYLNLHWHPFRQVAKHAIIIMLPGASLVLMFSINFVGILCFLFNCHNKLLQCDLSYV